MRLRRRGNRAIESGEKRVSRREPAGGESECDKPGQRIETRAPSDEEVGQPCSHSACRRCQEKLEPGDRPRQREAEQRLCRSPKRKDQKARAAAGCRGFAALPPGEKQPGG